MEKLLSEIRIECSEKLLSEIRTECSGNTFLVKVYTTILNRIKKHSGDPLNISEVSSCLFMSERTFYRRLKEQGSTYFKIKDEIRKKCSIYLLSSRKYTIKQISEFLFFNSSSSFIESFKRWYFCTPKQWVVKRR